MLVDTTPGQSGLAFKYWSPMSVGSWALLVYGAFAFVSFLEALEGGTGALTRLMAGGFGRVFHAVGAVLALFVASYTGVLLSVSNQPVWSDTWTLGGLFLASGLSGSAALLSAVASADEGLRRADGYFALLELILIVAFLATLAPAGTLSRIVAGPLLVLWILVAVSLIPPLSGLAGGGAHGTSASAGRPPALSSVTALVVLAGVLALRAVVIFSAQM
jgi:formate-dependent nitrite reductase membrane component NrfD